MTKMLVYTLPELAKEFRTSKENVYQLEELGEIKSIQFSSCKVVSIYEAERFLKESAGRKFDQILKEAKKRKNLESVSNVINLKEA
ncbi:hypothetical protein [Enterococcus gallinarum]|uniref:hypothetical protein n=1 Tax=Enterococcus gallinarum TaxID=1353 RepID=UPI00214C6F11|nr:hypothetical protein [Enterococcus gallinarum]MCR1943333.1 hypothetical protein [Enterococcus gallinarum]